MNRTLQPGSCAGTIAAIPSKSQAHRLLICAALADHPTTLFCGGMSKDILATIECLRGMGADIAVSGSNIIVQPIRRAPGKRCDLYCGESGSTLRFLLPVAGALALDAQFHLEGRLPERPMGPLVSVLEAHGMEIRQDGAILSCHGALQSGHYEIAGNISSQYISGLLFALPLLEGNSTLDITTTLESQAYISMTLDALAVSGLKVHETTSGYEIPGNQIAHLPTGLQVEGDWSNAAFPLCMGAVSGPITVTGLRMDSVQGDRQILDLLCQFGASVMVSDHTVTVCPADLHGITIDAKEIPDLIPVVSAVAAVAEGTTTIVNAGRLRLKESDRLRAIADLLTALGGTITEQPEGLIVQGQPSLRGGTADAVGDHRMAMTAAVCSLRCTEAVTVLGAESVQKSYPAFWDDFAMLRKEPTT